MGRNAWLRIQFVSENLANLKGRLSFHLNVINTFVSSLSLSALGRMEPALGRIELLLRESVREERKGNKEPTLLSAYENNDKASWEKIEMDLAVEGVSKQEFEKNKERIRELLEWVVDHGADLAALEEVGIGDSVSQTGPGEGHEQTQQSGEMTPSGKHKKPTANQLEIIETWRKEARPRRGVRGTLAKQTQENGLWKATGRLFLGSRPGERKYTYRAKAIESYEAQRPNELSYMKDETVEVAPTSGGWWPARGRDGKRGVISSDSFVLDSEIIYEQDTPTPTLFSRFRSNLVNEDDARLFPVFYYGTTFAKAWARETYVASPWCTNDLSFQKHELLELSTLGGLWWMGRNRNGETGIVPADHLAILWTGCGPNLSLLGKDEKGILVEEKVSIEALRKNENGVFDKYFSPEAIMKNWG